VRWEVDGSCLGSCPMVGYVITDVEPSCCTTKELIGWLVSYLLIFSTAFYNRSRNEPNPSDILRWLMLL
jgi:hypothetical protein